MSSPQPSDLSCEHQEPDRIKLESLRKDIQVGLDQIARDEVVTDFDVGKFLRQMKSRNTVNQGDSSSTLTL